VRSSPLAALTLGLVSAAAVCAALLDGCVLPSFTLATNADAGPDAAMMPETGAPTCVPVTYPDPPGGIDDGTNIGTLVFALRSVDFGDTGNGTPGYDLDHVCTCFRDAGNACSGKATPSTYCDADGGVDNQASKLIGLVGEFAASVFGSSVFSAQANSGKWTLLFRVDGYNGQPNDPAVNVALYPATGIPMPNWDGFDQWPVVASSVDGGVNAPYFVSDGAYVSNGVLVATMPTGELTIHGGGQDTITVRLSAGVITANLSQLGPSWRLQSGVFAGRWSLTEIFKSLSSYRDNNGKPLCTDQLVQYTVVKQLICQDADILVNDTMPKSAPCDALSIGIGFTADPALLGGISDAGVDSPGCPAATDPANDSCQ
jgi:hypothetical protein